MMPVLLGSFVQYLLGISLFVVALFLILLILVQRGRGGGLTGALGGVGGQSAFGTKAGDLFTRITIVAAAVWLILCLLTIAVLNGTSGFKERRRSSGRSTTADTKKDADTTDGIESGGLGIGGLGTDATGQPDATGGPATDSTGTGTGSTGTDSPSTGTDGAAKGAAGSTPSGDTPDASK